jgi:branched-chain amino acid transport system permease protein
VNSRTARILVIGVLVCAAVVLPPFFGTGTQSTLAFVAIAAIGAVGLNILVGYTGQLSLGHAFFMAVGAYTAAVLGGDHGLSATVWLPAAGVVAAVIGCALAPVAVRLRGLFLAIVTLGVLYIGQHIFTSAPAISGGGAGRTIPAVQIGPYDFGAGQEMVVGGVVIGREALYYYLALIVLALAVLYVANLSRSRFGRAMQATRDGELPAAVLGVDLTRTKLAAFTVSSFLAGISGALYASFLSYVLPDQWGLALSIQFLAAVIIGGMGSVSGPLVGALFVFALPDVLTNLPFATGTEIAGIPLRAATSLVYGALIIGVFLVEPRGIVGVASRVRSLSSRTPGTSIKEASA